MNRPRAYLGALALAAVLGGCGEEPIGEELNADVRTTVNALRTHLLGLTVQLRDTPETCDDVLVENGGRDVLAVCLDTRGQALAIDPGGFDLDVGLRDGDDLLRVHGSVIESFPYPAELHLITPRFTAVCRGNIIDGIEDIGDESNRTIPCTWTDTISGATRADHLLFDSYFRRFLSDTESDVDDFKDAARDHVGGALGGQNSAERPASSHPDVYRYDRNQPRRAPYSQIPAHSYRFPRLGDSYWGVENARWTPAV
jgi:hypothetical protein